MRYGRRGFRSKEKGRIGTHRVRGMSFAKEEPGKQEEARHVDVYDPQERSLTEEEKAVPWPCLFYKSNMSKMMVVGDYNN